ncbi:MAG: fatty acid desaturase, partial [Halocynthiibacter sp.]
MDHTSFLTSLPAETSRRLCERNNTAGLVHLAGHVGLIVLFGSLIALRPPVWWLLLPVQGIVLCFLFTLEHEATHKTPFASTALNEWAGRLAGLIILQPF